MPEIATLTVLMFASVTAIPVMFLAIQIGAAMLPARGVVSGSFPRCPSVAVVMPAHNEEATIARAVSSIVSQLSPTGRLLVVADNCTDSTAQIAERAGAEVTVRQDTKLVGKGYALDHGLRVLTADPPQVVIFVDADCEVSHGSLVTLATLCASTGRPVQARYSMLLSRSAHPIDKISRLAWTIKTFVRPLGSARLGWPCQLMGSGMALPFEIINRINLATGHLAEDQKLGAELALMGKLPLFCPNARVISRLPQGEAGKQQQRTRWEHGHLAIIEEFFIPLTRHAFRRGNLQLAAFALDLCIPPLSLLVLLLALMEGVTLSWLVATGSVVPLVVSSTVLACFAASIGAAWQRFGRHIISLRELIAAPGYCLARVPSLIRFFLNRQISWVRTER